MYHPEFGEYDRLDLYIALWHFCSLYHSGLWSRGYRILSRLHTAGFEPSPLANPGEFDDDYAVETIFDYLVREYRNSV